LFDIPVDMLPEVYPSSHIYGTTDKDIVGFEIPICGVAGDQQASLFGQCCFDEGDLKVTYGTGCFLLMNTASKALDSSNGLITTLSCQTDKNPAYALEGSVFVGGALIQWLRDELKLIEHASDTEGIAKEVSDTNGVYFVPAFVGLGAPYWNFNAEGIITGITRGTTRAHIIRASLEGIAYQVYDVITAMQNDLKEELKMIRVDGGAVANHFLMQFQSDILSATILKPSNLEITALGAFFLGALALKLFDSLEDLKKINHIEKTYVSKISAEEKEKLISGWQKAIRKACSQ
ncbi:MAG: glycerol kinase, partial [Anaeroplasmataceae bacterium]|nr:glycerol kinase [Anaeroplasmataceae bacterium]